MVTGCARREVRDWKVTFQLPPVDQRSEQVLELVEQLRKVLAAGPVADLTAPARRALRTGGARTQSDRGQVAGRGVRGSRTLDAQSR